MVQFFQAQRIPIDTTSTARGLQGIAGEVRRGQQVKQQIEDRKMRRGLLSAQLKQMEQAEAHRKFQEDMARKNFGLKLKALERQQDYMNAIRSYYGLAGTDTTPAATAPDAMAAPSVMAQAPNLEEPPSAPGLDLEGAPESTLGIGELGLPTPATPSPDRPMPVSGAVPRDTSYLTPRQRAGVGLMAMQPGGKGIPDALKYEAELKKQSPTYMREKALIGAEVTESSKRIQDAQKEIATNRPIISRLQVMEELLSQPGFKTGKIEEMLLPVRQMLVDLGWGSKDRADQVSKQTVFQAAASFIVPRMRVAGSGATSDFEANLFKSAAPNLANLPWANKILVKMFKGLAKQQQDYLRGMYAYRSQYGNLADYGRFYQEKIEKPIFNRYESLDEAKAAKEAGEISTGDIVIARKPSGGYDFVEVP